MRVILFVGIVLLMEALAGCDSASPNASPSADGTGSPKVTTTGTASASTTPSASVSRDCADAGAPSNGLTMFGATIGSWNARHQADPQGRLGSYGPVQNDGLDRYTSVMCTAGGDVSSYNINDVSSGLDLEQAKTLLRRELPADARRIYDSTVGTFCETLGYQSAMLARVFGESDPHGIVVAVILYPTLPQINSLAIHIGTSMSPPTTCA